MKLTKARIAWTGFACVGLLVVSLLLQPVFFPWSELNCSHEEIDIRTGRFRFTEYFLFVRVSERIEDSELTKVLPDALITDGVPRWKRVNTFSPGIGHSPHYAFHGAAIQIQQLQNIWEEAARSGSPQLAQFQEATARHLVALWQHDKSDWLAGQYLDNFTSLLGGERAMATIEEVIRLEMPVVEVDGPRVVTSVFYPSGRRMERIEGYVEASGEFVRHGLWEQWSRGGSRSLYGHYEKGRLHGARFEWDRDGQLSSIGDFTRGELTGYESEDLAAHPEYDTALRVGGAPHE